VRPSRIHLSRSVLLCLRYRADRSDRTRLWLDVSLAEDEARTLAAQNAELLGNQNADQRITYLGKIRSELLDYKQVRQRACKITFLLALCFVEPKADHPLATGSGCVGLQHSVTLGIDLQEAERENTRLRGAPLASHLSPAPESKP